MGKSKTYAFVGLMYKIGLHSAAKQNQEKSQCVHLRPLKLLAKSTATRAVTQLVSHFGIIPIRLNHLHTDEFERAPERGRLEGFVRLGTALHECTVRPSLPSEQLGQG